MLTFNHLHLLLEEATCTFSHFKFKSSSFHVFLSFFHSDTISNLSCSLSSTQLNFVFQVLSPFRNLLQAPASAHISYSSSILGNTSQLFFILPPLYDLISTSFETMHFFHNVWLFVVFLWEYGVITFKESFSQWE